MSDVQNCIEKQSKEKKEKEKCFDISDISLIVLFMIQFNYKLYFYFFAIEFTPGYGPGMQNYFPLAVLIKKKNHNF